MRKRSSCSNSSCSTSATTDVLGAGNYYVLVTDANGCSDTAQVTIGEPSPLQITVSTINASCNGSNGVGIVVAQGGRSPYSYQWFDDQFNDLMIDNDTIIGLPSDTFYVIVIDSNNCNVFETVIINENCATELNLNAFIEGFYLGGGAMQPVMWNGCYATSLDSNCYSNFTDCDTITVELHDQLSPGMIVPGGAVTTMLHVDGTAQAIYPGYIQGGTYWIVVKNRTIVETWSSQPVTFTGVTTSYNFTMMDTMAYGNNMRQMEPGVYAMYSGDIDDGTSTPLQDGFVDAFDFLIMDVDIQAGNSGYYVTDLNGDGFVDAFDFLVLDPNIQNGISRLTPP